MHSPSKPFRNVQIRLYSWDYRKDGAYFITLCTKDRSPFFGEIVNGQMKLSHLGILANVFWHEIKNHSTNVILEEFVVMPDHIHGILIIDFSLIDSERLNPAITGQNRFQNIGKNSLSSLIGSYKSAVTKHARRLGFEFAWQSRFHDHIIRDEQSFQRIKEYIRKNPENWKN